MTCRRGSLWHRYVRPHKVKNDYRISHHVRLGLTYASSTSSCYTWGGPHGHMQLDRSACSSIGNLSQSDLVLSSGSSTVMRAHVWAPIVLCYRKSFLPAELYYTCPASQLQPLLVAAEGCADSRLALSSPTIQPWLVYCSRQLSSGGICGTDTTDLVYQPSVCPWLQVPYYPPLQSPADFTPEFCQHIIAAAAGWPPDQLQQEQAASSNNGNGSGFQLCTVKDWVMSALVADEFAVSNNRVVLVGDSAHRWEQYLGPPLRRTYHF